MTSTPPPPPPPTKASQAHAAPYCRCVVARGRSPRVEMRFEGPTPVTCRVGASRDADWWLTGRGVPELALDLHWDGELLWVADRAGHGRASVDGEPLDARWRGLGGGCRLEFPGGALVADCSRPGVVTETVPPSAPSVPPGLRSHVREVLRPPPMPEIPEMPTRVAPMTPVADEPTRNWHAPRGTLPGLSPDRPRTIVPPPSPSTVDDLEHHPTREVLKSPPTPRPAGSAQADGLHPPSRRRRASTGG